MRKVWNYRIPVGCGNKIYCDSLDLRRAIIA